ncbi:phosphate/phosphite/phosphonate ABC transporter substrate-binding protein, partial [Synechococcus sp. Cruz CV-v-12]|uniref:phosphate/phosphite/phosphonate ABC transporter substrate-binding protein n=1 Tax=Synechococcus sp. Cruz CV-v-12 TaxID=2823728 RepID=UPI0020CF9064
IWSFGVSSVLATLALCLGVARAAEPVTDVSFGVVPLEAPTTMFKKFSPLKEFLERETGVKVKLAVAKDYQGAIDSLGKGETSIAYMTPTTLPKAQRQYPGAQIEPFARFQEHGKGTYRAAVIVPMDSAVTTLDQAKGKKIGFGNKDSTSSHLMQRSMLKEAGIDADKDTAGVEYLGSHTNVAKAVELKKVEIGCLKLDVAEKAVKEGKAKIVATSQEIPEFPVAFNNKMPAELRAKFDAAFKKLNDGSEASKAVLTAINEKYTGTEAAANADYDNVRKMIATLYGESFYAKAE